MRSFRCGCLAHRPALYPVVVHCPSGRKHSSCRARAFRYRQQRAVRVHGSGWMRAAHSVVCYRRETRRDSTRLGRVSFSAWSLAGMCCGHWHNSSHTAIIALGRAKHHGRMGSVCFPIVHLSRSPRAKPKVHFSHFRHGCSPCATPMFDEHSRPDQRAGQLNADSAALMSRC